MGGSPLEALGLIGRVEQRITPTLRHLELYSLSGLLQLFWHGDPTATDVVVAVGGAMGGTLGPGGGLYHDLGEAMAASGRAMVRVDYRRPNDLDACVHDTVAAAELASRTGADRFVVMGHSFGGAVAIQTGIVLSSLCAGVVTFATQSAGCETAEDLKAPLLLFHGDRDELLPMMASEVVRSIAGHGELVMLPGCGHLMAEAREAMFERLAAWVPEQFGAHEAAGRV